MRRRWKYGEACPHLPASSINLYMWTQCDFLPSIWAHGFYNFLALYQAIAVYEFKTTYSRVLKGFLMNFWPWDSSDLIGLGSLYETWGQLQRYFSVSNMHSFVNIWEMTWFHLLLSLNNITLYKFPLRFVYILMVDILALGRVLQ